MADVRSVVWAADDVGNPVYDVLVDAQTPGAKLPGSVYPTMWVSPKSQPVSVS